MQLPYIEPGTHLFKFLNHNTAHFWSAVADLLGQQKIFLSSRTRFNDPHDSNPEIENDLADSLIKNHAQEMLANPWRQDRDPSEILQILNTLAQNNTRLNKQQITNIKAQARQTARDYLDQCGLASFSLTMDQPLLWAHYAAGYSGICVVFKRNHSLQSGLCLCAKVNYCGSLPKLPLSLTYRMVAAQRSSEDFRELSDRIIFLSFLNKFKLWEYEQEARIFNPFRASTKIAFEKDELVGIVLGPKSPKTLEERLIAEIRRLAPAVQITRAVLSPTGYEIVFPSMPNVFIS
jgi:hypothetical protein